jgi:hypothetical protein
MSIGPALKNLLKRSGLEGLEKWASDMVINGASDAEIEISLYDQPVFRQRFPMIFERSNKGFGAISVQEVLEYENRAKELAKSFGTTITNEDISHLIANDVSLTETQDRLGLAGQAVHMASTDLKAELNRLYGITSGDLVKYWLDPKKEAPVLQRRFAAASIAEQAARSGWGELTAGQGEGLAKLGMDAGAASKGFSALVESEELFESVDETEEDIDVEDQLRVITGDQDMIGKVQKRGEKRAARFSEGGSLATGKSGVSGLGSANK